MKHAVLAVVFCLTGITAYSQNTLVDSLRRVISGVTIPISRFDLLNRMIDYNDGTQGNFQDTSIGLQMHLIAQHLNNDSLLAISTNVVGNYFRGRSEYPVALGYFFKALPLAEKAGDKRRISSLYFDIAECYYSLQNLEQCVRYARLGEQNLPDKTNPMYEFMALQFHRTMANFYLKRSLPDSALLHIHLIEEGNARLKKANYMLYSYIQNGLAYLQMGDKELSEIFFNKAYNLADSIGTTSMKLVMNYEYIPYLLATGQVNKARQQGMELLVLGKRMKVNLAVTRAADYLSRAYNGLHKADSAFYYLSMSSAYKDSVFNQGNINKIQSLAFNEEIRKIDEEARLSAAKEERRLNMQFALLAFGIISFIILFLLLSRSLITNTRLISFLGVVALLIVFEFLNLWLHPFLEKITHHSPVLMLFALVSIAALLVPLHHKIEHWVTAKLVEKNKAIRLANAKKTICKLGSEPLS